MAYLVVTPKKKIFWVVEKKKFFFHFLFAIKNKKEISTVVLKNWIAAYDTRLPETCVSDLPIISDLRLKLKKPNQRQLF
jgi:hypothetical protein